VPVTSLVLGTDVYAGGTKAEGESLHPPLGRAVMQTYLAETYVPRSRAEQVATATRIAGVAAELVGEGFRIELRRTTYIPGDEVCFYLFAASSADAVDALCRRAGLGHARIVVAVET
jgi:hypothetical protein